MEQDRSSTLADETFVCPNCGATQRVVGGIAARCERCGAHLTPGMSGESGIVGRPGAGVSDPVSVPPPTVAGGVGGVTDGTQVPLHPSSAIPGKPMPPIASDPEGGDDAGPMLDTPASGTHAERGGSG